ncbi:roadblock/LC7 domain-containing protein [Allostreptomyces psammosilenae]|uniref:Roadblock/LAMTOR2 domain-containing protein n=1 Tax=Allostreptomyces psammosilenae TaxID=1892865 RepID=A0A853A726_9ACTN|nr:roadblock/LC7 domain-containing protein [Allostreptomyces psammosilenae]NYI06348.1 hypothetical protein [Allostreptomyces psammosilenae]
MSDPAGEPHGGSGTVAAPEAPSPSRPLSRGARNLHWLLDEFTTQVPGVEQVVVVSSDGLLLASAAPEDAVRPSTLGLSPSRRADALATVVSGLVSLADGAARLMNEGELRQTVVTMDYGHLVVMAISDGSCLGVLAAVEADLSIVGYQMAVFVERAGHVLTPQLRSELHRAAATR